MQDQLFPVPFYEDTVVLVGHDNEPFVAMKPVVTNMGLDWATQFTKLKEKFSSVIGEITTTGGDGKQYEMVCLPLRKLPAWLYSISPNKVKPELQDKIVPYQNECDDALWDYWTKGEARRPGAATQTIPQLLATHREIRKLMQELKREGNPAIRRTLHAQLEQSCRLANLPVPLLEDIGRDVLPEVVPSLVDDFWEAVEFIGLDKLNHSRDPRLIAINLPHLAKLAAAEKLKLPTTMEFRRVLMRSETPRYVECNKTVNSRLYGRAVKCWMFSAV
ncbi:Antirepressor protein [Laribacter hongkongensis HLHK9]|uniref:Antirepressor protein n=1 Tax=Laribacter hongkongensis (strain HLHK9) TaxID=557598 RepID=C1D728_LARHH|nr:phage antirepressor N-terminal domain-containing protein [Laribacter hongkongensis]ACO74268.1 Antirepressor protein [Laribacter hongkongensis HLHK9]